MSPGRATRAETERQTAQMSSDVDLVGSWIAAADRVVVLTGAGISTDSGIPDFRGPQGVWTKNPTAEKTSTLQHYLADPDVRRTAWRMRVDSPLWSAQPNAGHRAIVEIERAGKLHGVVTQNIDELHQTRRHRPRAGDRGPRNRLVDSLPVVRRSATDGRDVGACARRGRRPAVSRVRGILKSDTISFGQSLVPEVIDRAMAVSRSCDVLVAVGSTLSVYPAAACVPMASAAGANVAIINAGPTEMDATAGAVLRGPISELLPAVVAAALETSG